MLSGSGAQKKRGRPRKTPIDSYEEVRYKHRLEISRMMDVKIHYPDRFDDTPILSRKQVKVEDLPIDTSNWDTYNSQIKALLAQYEKIPKPASSTNYPLKIFSEESDDDFSLEEENENENDLVKSDSADNTESHSYLYTKPPIDDFFPGSFDSLPEKAQSILSENRKEIFKPGITYQAQIEIVVKLIHSPKRGDGVGQTSIGKLFGISKGAIHTHIKRNAKIKKTRAGRPPLLDSYQNDVICEYVSNCYSQKQSPNVYTLIDMIYNKFNIYFGYHAIYNYVRNSSSLKTVFAPVYESSRADVKLEDIEIYYKRLDLILTTNKIPPSFVFNVDESGFVDFVDMRDEIVIVPIDAPEGTVKSAERNSKRATMIGCISLDGSALTPCIVLSNKRCEKELIVNGYCEPNVLIIYQKNGFINSRSFSYWAETVFIPELNHRRQKYGYDGQAVLLLDGCSPHSSDLFLDECSFQKVFPFFEPPGSSDQVQALDLGIFAVQKGLKTNIKTKENFGPSSKQVQQIVNSWIKTTTPDIVISAFNQAGIFKEEQKDGSFLCRASIEKARAVRNMEHIECKNITQGCKTIALLNFDD